MRRVGLACAVSFGAVAAAQTPPDYGFSFAQIGAAGNAAYSGPPTYGSLVVGRGRVDYSYRIARTEVSTGQWLQFLNTFSQAAVSPAHFDPYSNVHWGAEQDPTYAGPGIRYRLRGVPSAELLPVSGISFNMAALYCNWLQSGQSVEPSLLQSGSYNMSVVPSGPAPNQNLYPTHQPGARYWIPTLDEWIKAANYDPNRFGSGHAGWWTYRNSSDSPGSPGPPGVGTTSAGWEDPLGHEWDIPLGSYPASQSPWGLLDTSGGAAEWTEEISNPSLPNPTERYMFFPTAGPGLLQYTEWIGSAYSAHAVGLDSLTGLRIASAVPGPPSAVVLMTCAAQALLRCKRRPWHAKWLRPAR